MPLTWSDLNQTVTRKRPTDSVGKYGQVRQTWDGAVASQQIRAVVQPHRGKQHADEEGVVQDVTDILYCNLWTDPSKQTKTDIQEDDRIIDAAGVKYRVVYAFDEGGQGDHLKVLLTSQTPTGD